MGVAVEERILRAEVAVGAKGHELEQFRARHARSQARAP